MIIRTQNSLSTIAPKTYLLNTEVAGTTVFRMRNTNGFGSAWGIQIGETGEEQTETLLLSGNPGAGTLGTSTVVSRFEHPADTPVYAIKYSQVIFERSASGTAGSATPMTDGTVAYQSDNMFTQFDDTSGAVNYAYRTRFNNPTLGSTSQSDWITPAGFPFYSLAKLRQRIKEKLWDSSYLTFDSTINDWINEWKDKMSNAVIASNEDYALGTMDIGFGTAGYGTVTTADFSQIRKLEVTYNGGQDWYLSTKQNVNDFTHNQIFSSTHPYHNWLGDTIFQVQPTESGGTARITFYRFGTTMVNDTDELPLPMRSYTDSFVDYGEAMALKKDQKPEWTELLAMANLAKNDFVNKLTPRDKSGPSMVDIREPITGDDYWIF